MAKPGPKKGVRPGGRQKGTPNKDKTALVEDIRKHLRTIRGSNLEDWHPLKYLAEVATDVGEDTTLRVQAAKEVAQYITPKLKAVEHTGNVGQTIFIGADFGNDDG